MANDNEVKTKIQLIEGMEISTAERYIEFRNEIDNKLCQLMAQGVMLSALGEANHIDLCHVSRVGDLIEEIAGDIYGKLDDFISSGNVYLTLKEYKEREEAATKDKL